MSEFDELVQRLEGRQRDGIESYTLDERLLKLEKELKHFRTHHTEKHSRESMQNALGIAFAIALGMVGLVLAAFTYAKVF